MRSSMQFTYFGHSCFLMEIAGVKILFDPFITPNEKAKGIDLQSIHCDYIFVSHGHFDHVADIETIATNTGATIVGAYELAVYYGQKGYKHHPMNTGGSWNFGNFQAKAVHAAHSSVLPDGTYSGNPLGFVITAGQDVFYYSGDTALNLDMQLIGRQFKLSAAILSLGDNFTMGIDDALIAADFIQCNKIIGVHFDTFPYIVVNHPEAIEKFKNAGVELILPQIGQSYPI